MVPCVDVVRGSVVALVQALISVQALVFDLAQLTCQKRFDCINAKTVNEYDQEIPQSQTADNPVAP